MDASAARCTALIALALAASHAAAEGLAIRPDTVAWPRWQARVGVTTAAPHAELGTTMQLQSARLFGDYYFTGPGFGAGRVGGGLRATSGLLSGSPALALSAPTLPSREGLVFNLSARQTQTPLDASVDAAAPVPYLGVGYTGVSLRGRWGFSADVGLMGQGSGLRLARGATAPQSLDDLLRELRLTPVLQLGVSYSF